MLQSELDSVGDADKKTRLKDSEGKNKHSVGEIESLSVVELSRRLNLPESSVRFYCKRFADYVPCIGEGRRRRYLLPAVEVLSLIMSLMGKCKDSKGVERELAKYVPPVGAGAKRAGLVVDSNRAVGQPSAVTSASLTHIASSVDSDAVQDKMLVALERQTKALEEMALSVSKLCVVLRGDVEKEVLVKSATSEDGSGQPQCLDSESSAFNPYVFSELLESQAEIQTELQGLKRFISTLETTQQEDIQQLRDWLSRLAQELRLKANNG